MINTLCIKLAELRTSSLKAYINDLVDVYLTPKTTLIPTILMNIMHLKSYLSSFWNQLLPWLLTDITAQVFLWWFWWKPILMGCQCSMIFRQSGCIFYLCTEDSCFQKSVAYWITPDKFCHKYILCVVCKLLIPSLFTTEKKSRTIENWRVGYYWLQGKALVRCVVCSH